MQCVKQTGAELSTTPNTMSESGDKSPKTPNEAPSEENRPVDNALDFPPQQARFLEAYLPAQLESKGNLPYVTITYAASLDSGIALAAGARTALSGPESKCMTHFLRSRHEAILIGVGTAVADDPGLNCRLRGVGGYGRPGLVNQPVPIILDPAGRWKFTRTSRLFQLVREGRGQAPIILTADVELGPDQASILQEHRARHIKLLGSAMHRFRLDWEDVFHAIRKQGLSSVMVEGGGTVINSLLSEHASLVDSLVVTIAPLYLGKGSVTVCPPRNDNSGEVGAARRIKQVTWGIMGPDAVLCGRPELGESA
ncbi:MAG: 2,5-diamino-6-(ribosylamino)-4(3H)-pyrimidinone 5'-phosphate reductase [Vezdaea aestivalis]|nr:MAG: 2,5-diamino-6-(ribosylamino)-4(3H)-pyrimidinone 5'-phosphate reductase [Vezdaea aestivalis]